MQLHWKCKREYIKEQEDSNPTIEQTIAIWHQGVFNAAIKSRTGKENLVKNT